MSGNDAKKLKRGELLELLIEQTEENQRLAQANRQLEEKLAQRVILLENSGSIAEAALSLSHVFAQAQDAADRYLESVRRKEEEARELLRQTEAACEQLLQKTRAECQELERKTRDDCEKRLAEASQQTTAGEEEAEPPRQEQPLDEPRGFLGRFLNRR